MDLDFEPAAEEFRAEVRGWLAAHLPATPLPPMDTAEGASAHREWERLLADARLSVVSWPVEYGGRAASLLEWLVFEEEYHAAGAPARIGQNGLFLLAPTLFEHGTQEQRDRLLPRMGRAEEVWAQAWSEPEAGSDLAAIRCRAERTDGGWLLRGLKTWSSRAPIADRAFGLFRTERSASGTSIRTERSASGTSIRTDPDASRHQGLTYFLFDLGAPGVVVRPITQLDGRAGFAEVFLDGVFVPDADVLGEVGDGWRVAMSTTRSERGLSLRSPGRFEATAARLVALWRETGDEVDTALADRVTDGWITARAYRLRTLATVTRLSEGGGLGAESSVDKLIWSQLDLALHDTALDLLGADAELLGRWTEGWMFALAGPIYAGTNEIQRGVVAERLLGLPRGRR
ncbi:MAG TPA: acyl-CoA dehydrogenase family protein [Pseudonocardia sp.]|nr:acyl-CoA dehydrogenase family protein [Pseudonocardia sp.]